MIKQIIRAALLIILISHRDKKTFINIGTGKICSPLGDRWQWAQIPSCDAEILLRLHIQYESDFSFTNLPRKYDSSTERIYSVTHPNISGHKFYGSSSVFPYVILNTPRHPVRSVAVEIRDVRLQPTRDWEVTIYFAQSIY